MEKKKVYVSAGIPDSQTFEDFFELVDLEESHKIRVYDYLLCSIEAQPTFCSVAVIVHNIDGTEKFQLRDVDSNIIPGSFPRSQFLGKLIRTKDKV